MENKINFYFDCLNINNNIVREFHYLLPYISDGKVENFDDLEGIVKYKETILKNINIELSKKILSEEAYYNISNFTARSNMENLKIIVITIQNLNNYANSLNLSISQILEIFKNKKIENEK